MNTQCAKTEPDPDAIKMFVGQIPRSMGENDLREMFGEFGHIYQLNVLVDKVTGQSKGCCFVTFFTRKAALDAQNALHNIKTMSGMQHPIQMKPADSEKRNVEERKLFVGMLAKKSSENEVRMMFSPFGTIEECTVLREQNGQSKGCAFITYANRQCAQNCIKSLHHSQTMEGCRTPLVVKFADTQKEKEMKKWQQLNSNMQGSSNNMMGPQYLAALTQLLNGNNSSNLNSLNNTAMNMLQMQQLLTAASALTNPQGGETPGLQHLQNLQGLAALASLASNPALNNSLGLANLSALSQLANGSSGNLLAGSNNHSNNSSSGPGLSGSSNNSSHQSSGLDNTLNQAYSGIQQYAASFPSGFQNAMQQSSSTNPAGKVTEGPEGANLFIYHLPQEFGDAELLQAFISFGTIVSAKVFIDKQTNLSKCFGFVSYDNNLSAQAAIQAMNGFQIGMKRLKVQLKRPKSENKPY